jgi:Xaa-Pro aminopeptidase
MRQILEFDNLGALRLRGADWFAWATSGGSSIVDSSSERGVAEVLVTADHALVLADRIDGRRIADEQLPSGFELVETPWARPVEREQAVARVVAGRTVASDRPIGAEVALPESMATARRALTSYEIERFRAVGRDSAVAASLALRAATPDMTETDLAAVASERLIERGLDPVVVLVGGERRLPIYRHPMPRHGEPLGRRAMLVLCARRHGLIANLTRFAYFEAPTADERRVNLAVAEVEAAAFDASRPGVMLGDAYRAMVAAYARLGFAGAELDHHQGGLCGYRTRDEVATESSVTEIRPGSALAWNPSLPGAKIEDTVVVGADGLEVVTVDPDWPTFDHRGRRRPDLLVPA